MDRLRSILSCYHARVELNFTAVPLRIDHVGRDVKLQRAMERAYAVRYGESLTRIDVLLSRAPMENRKAEYNGAPIARFNF